MEKYIFDPSAVAFEPVDDVCCFCNKEKAVAKLTAYCVLYKQQKHLDAMDEALEVLLAYRKYDEIKIGLQKCKTCTKRIQEAEDKQLYYSIVLFSALFFLFLISSYAIAESIVVKVALLIALLSLFTVRKIIYNGYLRFYEIKTEQEVIQDNDFLQKLIREDGFILNKKG